MVRSRRHHLLAALLDRAGTRPALWWGKWQRADTSYITLRRPQLFFVARLGGVAGVLLLLLAGSFKKYLCAYVFWRYAAVSQFPPHIAHK